MGLVCCTPLSFSIILLSNKRALLQFIVSTALYASGSLPSNASTKVVVICTMLLFYCCESSETDPMLPKEALRKENRSYYI